MSAAANRVPDVLQRILCRKAEEVAERAEQESLRALSERVVGASPPRGFLDALRRRVDSGQAAVIAESKRASPSKGLLREGYDPAAIGASYARHGAACLSVLTDRDYFQGDDSHLIIARHASGLPVLRKDFVIDPYQVYEARVLGADCVLLIVAALGDPTLGELAALATELGMDVLVEVHDQHDLERALALGPTLIGINNRDLRSFEVSLETTLELHRQVPAHTLVVTESGIHEPAHVAVMRENGIHAFLVGEAFMRAPDPGAKLASLFGEEAAE
jgi:indole-3-glycerol phosphate synthase